MRILYITQKFPPKELGGADLQTYRIANGICRNGHEVYVICAEDIANKSILPGEIQEENYPFDDIPIWRLSYNWNTMPDPYWSIYGINQPIEEIILKHLQNIRPDIVHVTSCSMVTAAALTAPISEKIPLVITLTGKWGLCPIGTLLKRDGSICSGRQDGITCLWCLFGETRTYNGLLALPETARKQAINMAVRSLRFSKISPSLNLIRCIEKRNSILADILAKVDVILSPSHCHIEIFSRSGLIQEGRMIYSPHGRDLKSAEAGKNKTPSKNIRFAYTGQIVPHKGVDTLITAFKLLPPDLPAELHIFGDSNKDPACQHYKSIAGSRENIIWRGPYKNSEVREILATVDIVIVPSNCVENDPGTIAEAFAAKTPVIGSDTCGVVEHIHHDVNGLIFKRGDTKELAHQLHRIIEEPDLLSRLRSNIKTPKNIDENVVELIQIYKNLIQEYQSQD